MTVPEASFQERVAAAAAGGYAAIGLRPNHLRRARDEGLSDADLRSILADRGIEAAEIEVLFDFAAPGERGQRSRHREEAMFEVADVFGSRHLVVHTELEVPLEQVAEQYAGLCDRAAEHGLLVAIEFLPWTSLADAPTAGEIVRLAGRDNGGLLIDSWHVYRGVGEHQLEGIPAERIFVVQIDDADPEPVGDLVRFLRLMDQKGVRAPISVEVISDEMGALTPVDAARRAADATRAVLRAARA